MSDSTSIKRLSTLVYKLMASFNYNTSGEITTVKLPSNVIIGDGVKRITVSATPPVNPQPGDLWIDIS